MKNLLFVVTVLISTITAQRGGLGVIYRDDDEDDGFIVFPQPESSPGKEIPIDLILKMNEVSDLGDFMNHFIYSDTDNVTLTQISSRFAVEGIERSAVTKAKMAVCMPELKTVSVRPEKDSAVYYHPSCIRVERCGGCCVHSLLTCTPVESEILNVKVAVAEYRGGTRLHYRSEEIIPVERHTKCKCDCKIQPENCSKFQKYNREKCSCDCNNPDSEKKCYEERESKIWNKDRCACLCRQELECGTGFIFDPFTCKCEEFAGRRKQQAQKPWIA